MLTRVLIAAVVVLLVGCSDCANPCKNGVSYSVSPVAGNLAPGVKQDLELCVDGACSTVTISRADVGRSVFVPFDGVGGTGDHHLTVSGPGSLAGEYNGPLESFAQSNGDGCDTCHLVAVRIEADGTLTPASAAVPNKGTSTTSGGG